MSATSCMFTLGTILSVASVAAHQQQACTTDGAINVPGVQYSAIKRYWNGTTTCEETCIPTEGVGMCSKGFYVWQNSLLDMACSDRNYTQEIDTQFKSTICNAEVFRQFYRIYSMKQPVLDALVRPLAPASTTHTGHQLVAIGDGPHKCTAAQPVTVYKVNDAEWCETFCFPESLVGVVEQFGDVKNGTCVPHGYIAFDHSERYYLYGANITVDLYKKKSDERMHAAPATAREKGMKQTALAGTGHSCCACVKGSDMGSDLWSMDKAGADCNACCVKQSGSTTRYTSGKPEPSSVCASKSGAVQIGSC